MLPMGIGTRSKIRNQPHLLSCDSKLLGFQFAKPSKAIGSNLRPRFNSNHPLCKIYFRLKTHLSKTSDSLSKMRVQTIQHIPGPAEIAQMNPEDPG
jgi:hypothetical protein